ncbi:MAG TPA: DEAD/DEAH box helicase [Syntrophobacteraceae bacterium]|nr:DEAD/DEAH box helicase [Syntrophobacteraceae bacterium]
MNTLKRAPFPKQAETVLALLKGFKKDGTKGLFLTAEMGTGKTLMAIAVSFILCPPRSRTLVMCPGHLVRKWIREIEETIPHAKTVNLNGPGLAELFELRRTAPAGREFYIIGKERSKNHYARASGVMVRRHFQPICPRCGSMVDPVNPKVRKDICQSCSEPLWQADGKKGFRRFAKAEFVKRYFRRGAFDLFIGDEVQQYKSGDSAQGQAFANFAAISRHVLCLTGTLMGGYVTNLFYLLWRTNPHRMKDVTGSYKSVQRFAERYGVLEEIIKEPLSDNSNSIGGKRTVTVRERPGISPLVFTDLLLEQSVFMRLSDISVHLPPYMEHVVSVEMTTEQSEAYTEFEDTLRKEVRQALARGDRSLLGAMLQSLLAYPDGARRGETVTHPRHLTPDGSRVLVASAPRLDIDLLPKEEKLLEILKQEKSRGRRVLLYLEHTGTRDLIPDLAERIGQSGLSALVLRQHTTSAENRETWVKARLSEGDYELLVCNPRLVETGLDLVEFPTIIFFQCGYSTFTLRQASRRSWRIGQRHPVEVYYLSYAGTMQETALSLMGTKMQVALMVEGELSDRGLTALAEGDSSMLVALAKSLVGDEEVAPLSEAWTELMRAGINAESLIGAEDNEKETVTVEKGDRKATLAFERIVRGRVYVRKGYAVGYVDGHRFIFRNGKVTYKDNRIVGEYHRNGTGTINEKPFQLVSSGNGREYMLVELRATA